MSETDPLPPGIEDNERLRLELELETLLGRQSELELAIQDLASRPKGFVSIEHQQEKADELAALRERIVILRKLLEDFKSPKNIKL